MIQKIFDLTEKQKKQVEELEGVFLEDAKRICSLSKDTFDFKPTLAAAAFLLSTLLEAGADNDAELDLDDVYGKYEEAYQAYLHQVTACLNLLHEEAVKDLNNFENELKKVFGDDDE